MGLTQEIHAVPGIGFQKSLRYPKILRGKPEVSSSCFVAWALWVPDPLKAR